MTEQDERPVGWRPPPTLPGVVSVLVVHPDDPPERCSVAEAKGSQRRRWRCPCGAKGTAAMPTLALADVLAHEGVCPRNPSVAAARDAARDRLPKPAR